MYTGILAHFHTLSLAPSSNERQCAVMIHGDDANFHKDLRVIALNKHVHLRLVARPGVITSNDLIMIFISQVTRNDVVVDGAMWGPRS